MLLFFYSLLPRQVNTTMDFTYYTVEIPTSSSSVIAPFVVPGKWRWYHKRYQKSLSQESEEQYSNQCCFIHCRTLTATQAWGLYNELLQNFTARLFFRQHKYAKVWGKRKREERRIIHSVLFGRMKWSVLAHWRITQNTSTLSCAMRGVNAEKNLYHCSEWQN